MRKLLGLTKFFVKPGVFLVIGLFFIPSLLLAQSSSSDFRISVLGGDDTTPPTTPTLLLANPVAQTQIDITWSASTDNFILDGYVLLRDGSPIATTTLTTYVDTGLTASTSYTYEVYAFDSFLNISTTSNALSTTTLAVPVVPPTPTSTAASASTATRVLRLVNLNITPGTNSATFLWQTTNPSRYVLRWGRSDAYDEGYIVNDTYRTNHQTLVGDLEPGAVYLYELIGYGANGIAITLKEGQFKTVSRESLAPENVQNLQVRVSGDDVNLSWINPSAVIDPTIRIVRSHLGYPADPYDGAIVYEGKGNNYLDQGALSNYGSQFYTVFVISADGSVSSGAVARARKVGSSTATSTEPLPLEEELIEIPDFGFGIENILLNQGDNHFDFKSERIKLFENEPFIISIPFAALPDNLKSIIVTLLDPTDERRSYSFLLRINKDRTAYEATIAPLGVHGASRLQIEIFDYQREIIGRYRKQIDFVRAENIQTEVVFPDKIVRLTEYLFSTISLIFLLILLILFFLWRRSRETEDKH